MMRTLALSLFVGLIFSCSGVSFSQTLNVPPRPADALSATALVEQIWSLEREDREAVLLEQFSSGNIPDFQRTLVPVTVTESIGGKTRTAVYYVTPEYLCFGSNEDYFLCPTTPTLAQQLADRWGANLPTRKMVNQIWSAAEVKLSPSPISPSPAMTTVPVFADHNTTVAGQRAPFLTQHPLGALVGGHKKDVVVTAQLATTPNKVAIYGWHYTSGTPIQPLYLGHVDWYADYSHGIRMVAQAMTVDGEPTTVAQVLADPVLAPLLSDEGAFTSSRYPVPLPPSGFPYCDNFPPTGRQLVDWTDRFTTPELISFSPAAPAGDGWVLVVRDPSGGIDTTRLGSATDSDYFVQCDLYCRYRPQLSSDGYERIGIFIRDDGAGMFEGSSSGGIPGNNYALTWDSHSGAVRCLKTVNGTPTDLAASVTLASSAWRKFRIEADGSKLIFKIDGETIATVTDTTFTQGQFGIGYHDYYTTNTNIIGTYADNFLAGLLSDGSSWKTY